MTQWFSHLRHGAQRVPTFVVLVSNYTARCYSWKKLESRSISDSNGSHDHIGNSKLQTLHLDSKLIVLSITAAAISCLYNRLSSRSNVSYRTARVLPSHLVNGTVGWMAASKKRRLLAMIITLGLVWAFVPRGRKMILADFWKKKLFWMKWQPEVNKLETYTRVMGGGMWQEMCANSYNSMAQITPRVAAYVTGFKRKSVWKLQQVTGD